MDILHPDLDSVTNFDDALVIGAFVGVGLMLVDNAESPFRPSATERTVLALLSVGMGVTWWDRRHAPAAMRAWWAIIGVVCVCLLARQWIGRRLALHDLRAHRAGQVVGRIDRLAERIERDGNDLRDEA